jgi:type II secretory pathway component PulC
VNDMKSAAHNFVPVLAGILVIAGLARTFWPLPASEDVADAPELVAPLEFPSNALAVVDDMSAYAVIHQKSLFGTDRRQYVAPESVVSQPSQDAAPVQVAGATSATLSLEVFGIVRTPDASLALVRSPGSTESRRLQVNDAIEGWTVAQIEDNKLVLRRGDEEQLLHLVQRQPDNSD